VNKQFKEFDTKFGRSQLNIIELQVNEASQKKVPLKKEKKLIKQKKKQLNKISSKVKIKKINKSPLILTEKNLWKEMNKILESPKAKPGMKHFSFMTEERIEILTDKKEMFNQNTQTQNFISMSKTSKKNAVKKGVDAETQIEENEVELIDIDKEIEPIIQVLIYQTLEQSRMEVLEEEEILLCQKENRRMGNVRLCLLNEIQRITIKENRLNAERKRRKDQISISSENAFYDSKKKLCQFAAKICMKKFKNNVFDKLENLGYFAEGAKNTLRKQFLPSLVHVSETKIDFHEDMKFLLAKILQDAKFNLLNKYKESKKRTQCLKTNFVNHELVNCLKTDNSEKQLFEFESCAESKEKVISPSLVKTNLVIGDTASVFLAPDMNADPKNNSSKKKMSDFKNQQSLFDPNNFGRQPNCRVHLRRPGFPSLLISEDSDEPRHQFQR
jgi:hypothetical protein